MGKDITGLGALLSTLRQQVKGAWKLDSGWPRAYPPGHVPPFIYVPIWNARLLEHIGSSWPRGYRESGAASAVISSRNAEEERLYGIGAAQQPRPPGDAASGTASLCTSYIAQSTGDLSCPRQDAPSARISSQHVRELLAVRSQAAVTALLKECPQIAELEPSCILSRLVRLKGHCSGCMNPTDLVFLEPRILLWDGPFVTCPYTMEVLSKIAKNIGEMIIMMTKETNSGDGDTIRWKDHIEFGDAVPFVDNFYARIKDLKRDVIGCEGRGGRVADGPETAPVPLWGSQAINNDQG
ncbi:g4278 [Coccomyxa viridis]|uniref:G4278 protein n=1 Tax=Coccomyxa viridis TaxID=1274662 RepID=A0ABP1FSP5_9CHLO